MRTWPPFFAEWPQFCLQKTNRRLQRSVSTTLLLFLKLLQYCRTPRDIKWEDIKRATEEELRHEQVILPLLQYITLRDVDVNWCWFSMGGFTSIVAWIRNSSISNGQSRMGLASRLCVDRHLPRTTVVYHSIVMVPEDELWWFRALKANIVPIITFLAVFVSPYS